MKIDENGVMIIYQFPDKETGEIVICFANCSKCQYLDKCDHADPDHY